MNLSKPKAILLAIATAFPVVYLFFFIGSMFFMVLMIDKNQSDTAKDSMGSFFIALFVLHFVTIFWVWGLVAFYIVFLFKTDSVPKDQKALWAVVLFMGNLLAMPIFWYLHVWRPLQKSAASLSDPIDH